MTKIYLAAMYSQMLKMRQEAFKLELEGHSITARWIAGKEHVDAVDQYAVYAQHSIEDIDAADLLVHYAQPRDLACKGGGRHWEFGYAYARGKICWIVGPKGEHVFHYAPGVRVFDRVEDVIEALK